MRNITHYTYATILIIGSTALAQTFDVSSQTIDGGGGTSTGGVFEVSGTVGQPDAGQVLTGGVFELTGGFWLAGAQVPGEPIEITSTHSCLIHGQGGPNEADLCIDLLAENNPVEPRLGGPDTLRFGFSGDIDSNTVIPANVQINCVGDPAGAFSVSLDAANAIVVSLDAPIHAEETCDNDTTICGNCCTIGFDGVQSTDGGPVNGTGTVMVLAGDIDFNTGVTGGDLSIIKPHFGELPGDPLFEPQFDYDRTASVTGSDFSLLKPLLGRLAPACP